MPCDSTLPAASFSTWWQLTQFIWPPSVPRWTSYSRVVAAKAEEMSPCLTLSSPPAYEWQNRQPLIGGTPAFWPTLCATAVRFTLGSGAPAVVGAFL